MRETRVEVFHTIDIEVLDHCGEAILTNAGVTVLPWAPHARRRLVPFSAHREFLTSGLTLADYLDLYPVLRQLADAGQLFWHNLGTAPQRLRRPEAPMIPAEGLSACTGMALLASSGVRAMRTLGVDGGRTYAECFQDLHPTAAAALSFDSQFATLARLIGSYRLDLGPLDHPMPARGRIRAAPQERLPALVLAESLLRHSSLTLDLTLIPADARSPGRPRARGGGTCEVAAYCLIEADLCDIWTRALPGGARLCGPDAQIAAPPAPWQPRRAGAAVQSLVTRWPADGPQPWRHTDAPEGTRWCAALLAALAAGAISRSEITQAVEEGLARPSLLTQIDRHLADPRLLPRRTWEAERYPGQAAARHKPNLGPDPCRNLGRTLGRVLAARTRHALARLAWPHWTCCGASILDKVRKVLGGIGR